PFCDRDQGHGGQQVSNAPGNATVAEVLVVDLAAQELARMLGNRQVCLIDVTSAGDGVESTATHGLGEAFKPELCSVIQATDQLLATLQDADSELLALRHGRTRTSAWVGPTIPRRRLSDAPHRLVSRHPLSPALPVA